MALKAPSDNLPSKKRRKFRVQQAIFTGAAAADGAHLTFASLSDGRCALLRDGALVAAWGSDVYGVDVGVRRFLVETAGAAAAVSPSPGVLASTTATTEAGTPARTLGRGRNTHGPAAAAAATQRTGERPPEVS